MLSIKAFNQTGYVHAPSALFYYSATLIVVVLVVGWLKAIGAKFAQARTPMQEKERRNTTMWL